MDQIPAKCRSRGRLGLAILLTVLGLLAGANAVQASGGLGRAAASRQTAATAHAGSALRLAGLEKAAKARLQRARASSDPHV